MTPFEELVRSLEVERMRPPSSPPRRAPRSPASLEQVAALVAEVEAWDRAHVGETRAQRTRHLRLVEEAC